MSTDNRFASAGHKLGQIVGDWYEEYFAFPMLKNIAHRLNLTLHSRFIANSQTIWLDADSNSVDYDFVMCLPDNKTPVAFIETFWRRGARHSKDKSRDDCGKLLPMLSTYSTTRILSIIAAGDFTAAAREFVKSRGVELFYIAKNFIVTAWQNTGAIIDYPDKINESNKSKLLIDLDNIISSNPDWGENIANTLLAMPGIISQINSYSALMYSKLKSVPVEYMITISKKSDPMIFTTYQLVDVFLYSYNSQNIHLFPNVVYTYEVDFGNGDTFKRDNLTFNEMIEEHNNLKNLLCIWGIYNEPNVISFWR